MSQLDETFRAQRAALRAGAVAQAQAIWLNTNGNRNQYLAQILTLVEGAQKAVVALTSAYLTLAGREQLGEHVKFKGLSQADYTIEKLRGEKPTNVYARPYGVLYGQLNGGASEDDAHQSALADVAKLVATDIQLAYTVSAADWMKGDKQVAGYKRVLSGTCDYCESAASGMYGGHATMPIHENCDCAIEPVFGSRAAAVASTGLPFHAGDAGTAPAGDLEIRLKTQGKVPRPLKRRRRG